jgi:hypothetical protein
VGIGLVAGALGAPAGATTAPPRDMPGVFAQSQTGGGLNTGNTLSVECPSGRGPAGRPPAPPRRAGPAQGGAGEVTLTYQPG